MIRARTLMKSLFYMKLNYRLMFKIYLYIQISDQYVPNLSGKISRMDSSWKEKEKNVFAGSRDFCYFPILLLWQGSCIFQTLPLEIKKQCC